MNPADLTPGMIDALALIASRSCETFTTGPGACTRSDRYAYSDYGIHRWCDPCVAWAVLNGVPLTRHPSGWCEACGAVVIERIEVAPPGTVPWRTPEDER